MVQITYIHLRYGLFPKRAIDYQSIMNEYLSAYLAGIDIKVKYMHSDIKALERMEIIRDLLLKI